MFVNQKLERDMTHVFPTNGAECPWIDERVKSIGKIGKKDLCMMLNGLETSHERSNHNCKSLGANIVRQNLERVRNKHRCIRKVIKEEEQKNARYGSCSCLLRNRTSTTSFRTCLSQLQYSPSPRKVRW